MRMFKITDDVENLGPLGKTNEGLICFFTGRRMGSTKSAVEVFFIRGASEEWHTNFEKELRKWAEVNEERHAKLPRILSSGFTASANLPFIEMEYIDGISLDEKLNQDISLFSITDISTMAEQVSRTLAHCHNLGLLHGGICSDNIFFQKASGNYIVTGFGLSMLNAVQRKEQLAYDTSGTMAPEQKNGDLLPESDIYRFGMMMYELVTSSGHGHFSTMQLPQSRDEFFHHLTSRRQMAPGASAGTSSIEALPSWISDMIFRCVQHEPENRFRNGVQLYDFILLANRIPPGMQNPIAGQQGSSTIERVSRIDTRNRPGEKKARRIKAPQSVVRSPVVTAPKTNKKISLYGLVMAAIMLAAFALFGLYSYQKKKNTIDQHATTSTVDTSRPAVPPQREAINTAPAPVPQKTLPKALRNIVEDSKIAIANQPEAGRKKIMVHPWKPEGTTVDNHTGLGDYRVISKAYFYTTPDEASRRNAFIVHWNNAILHPIEEKNDFIYIVYTNNEGHTSKGWLRKKDIVRVGP